MLFLKLLILLMFLNLVGNAFHSWLALNLIHFVREVLTR